MRRFYLTTLTLVDEDDAGLNWHSPLWATYGLRARRIADLRPDRTQATGRGLYSVDIDDATHAIVSADPDVTYIPFEDSLGNVLSPGDAAADISAAGKVAIGNFLEARGVPTPGLLSGTIADALNIIARRAWMRWFLRANDFPDDMDALVSSIPQSRQQSVVMALEAQGIDTSGLQASMTVREALVYLLARVAKPTWSVEKLS